MRITKLALGSVAVLAVVGLAPVALAAGHAEPPAPSGDSDPCVTETVHPAEQVEGGEIGSAVAENACE